MNHIRIQLALILGMAVGSVSYASMQAIDLGSLAGGADFFTEATAVNDAGQVTGRSNMVPPEGGGAYHAFITGPNGTGLRDIGTMGGASSLGNGINSSGQVVGVAQTSAGDHRAFVTGANGVGLSPIASFIGPGSAALGINDAGQVVGEYRDVGSTNPPRLFMTVIDGGSSTAWGLGFSFHSAGNAINNSGKVVGYGDDSRGGTGPNHVVVGGPSPVVAFEKLWTGQADDINDSGKMVGEAYRPGNSGMHAFIANVGDADWTDLGTLGGSDSRAWGINNSGQVVGSALTLQGDEHAFVWDPSGGGMIDLNSLVSLPDSAYFREAKGINNSGQIIANASNGHAYLLVAVPEPSMMMLGLGLAGIVGLRRRRG